MYESLPVFARPEKKVEKIFPREIGAPELEMIERKLEDKEAVIFDFDGTLVDAEPVLIQIVNDLAPELGYAPITPEQIPELRKMGAKSFVLKRLGISLWRIRSLERRAREEYAKRIKDVVVFPGMKEVVEKLKRAGYRTGVISSNATSSIEQVLKQADIEVDFIASGSLFGKAKSIQNTLQEQELDSKEVIYIGDELRDVEASQKSKVDVIAVTWGLNEQKALEEAGAVTVNTPAELLEKLVISSPPQ